MKETFLFSLLTIVAGVAKSQDTVYIKHKRDIATSNTKAMYTGKPPQALYVELYGRAIVYSVNYDTRFSKRLNGPGFSAGIGGLALAGVNFVAIPITVNNLAGNNGRYFEAGAGITLTGGNSINFNHISIARAVVLGTVTLGYRSQPVAGGLNFRGGLNVIGRSGLFAPYPYASLGYSF